MSSSCLHLLTLPLEVRALIWKASIPHIEYDICRSHKHHYCHRRRNPRNSRHQPAQPWAGSAPRNNPYTPLLLLNKQVRAEVLSFSTAIRIELKFCDVECAQEYLGLHRHLIKHLKGFSYTTCCWSWKPAAEKRSDLCGSCIDWAKHGYHWPVGVLISAASAVCVEDKFPMLSCHVQVSLEDMRE